MGHVACVVGLCFLRSWLIGICGSIRVEMSHVEFLDLSQANHFGHTCQGLFSSTMNESYGIEDDQTLLVQVWFKFQWTRDLLC